MTALNAPLSHGHASHDFRRGLLVGTAATAMLAATLAAAGFAAGLVGTGAPEAAAPAVQVPSTQADPGLAPRTQAVHAPAAESYPDMGIRNAPAAPAVEPYVDFGQRHAPAPAINQHNPHRNGPIEAW